MIADATEGPAASGAAPTAIVASAAARVLPEPYAPGRGDKIPAPIRRVRRGYSWMAWGAVFGGWALVAAGGYFSDLNNSYPTWGLAALPLWVLAAVLLGHRIRLSRFLRRSSDARGATVAACGRGGHMLMLDAPWDGYSSTLKVRLAWWAEPELLPPGVNVTFYGRRGGVGRVLVSGSAQGRAFVGTGRRRAASQVSKQAVQDGPPQPGDRGAGRRYLRWAPPVIAGTGFILAVAATLIAAVPSLTGHLAYWQLRPGDCLTGSNLGLGTGDPWPYMVAAAPCTDRHLAEVFFSGNAWPQSLAYPGYNAISDQGYARCLAEFKAYDGLDNSESAFMIYFIAPSGGDDWTSGDRRVVCMAYQPGLPMVNSIKGTIR